MRLAERHAFAHEIIRQVGRQQRRIAGRRVANSRVHRGVSQHGGHESRRDADGVGRVEQPFLVLLQITVVGHRQTFQERQQRDQVADDASCLAARQLGDVRVFLLRHQRRAGRVSVRDFDEIKLGTRP